VGGVVLNVDEYTGNPANLIDTALIHVESRSFPIEITVVDAQYVYRPLPANVRPGGWWGEPFFQNSIPEGVYVGQSANWTFYNKFCYDHYDFRYWELLEQEAAENENTSDPPDTEEFDPFEDFIDEDDIYGEE
jgi:hypothetical protein